MNCTTAQKNSATDIGINIVLLSEYNFSLTGIDSEDPLKIVITCEAKQRSLVKIHTWKQMIDWKSYWSFGCCGKMRSNHSSYLTVQPIPYSLNQKNI